MFSYQLELKYAPESLHRQSGPPDVDLNDATQAKRLIDEVAKVLKEKFDKDNSDEDDEWWSCSVIEGMLESDLGTSKDRDDFLARLVEGYPTAAATRRKIRQGLENLKAVRTPGSSGKS